MNNVPLKLYVFFFLSCLLSATTYAQSFHYIYIQTENKEPFYVKMDKNTLNSSESGYILIPKLIEGTYQCSIGFLKKGLPELNITINVKNINEGFLLKNTEEKGWMMVNLQSADKVPLPVLLIPNNEVETKLVGDEFARVLAQVLQDTSIFEAVAVKKYEDSSAIVGNKQIDIPATKGIEIPILLVPQLVVDKITKLQYDSTFENLVIIYQDLVNSIPDTIKLIIPLERSILTPASEKEMEVPYIVTSIVDTVKNDSRFIDMELQNPNQKIDLSTNINDDFVITEKKRTLQIIPDSIASNKLARVDTIKDKKTKAAAISYLAKTSNVKYKLLYEKNISDSSYSVVGAALEGLLGLDETNAYVLAKKYSEDAKGSLGEIVGEIIMKQGTEADFYLIATRFEKMPLSQEKIGACATFAGYLEKISDIKNVKKGIDKIINFRNLVPEQFRSFIDPMIKGGLNKLGKAKGKEIEDYIEAGLK